MEPQWLSNSYLVGEHPGGNAVLIDAGGPTGPLDAAVERHRLTVTHLLLTHHHTDHVAHVADYRARYGMPVLAHELEAEAIGGVDSTLAGGDSVQSGGMQIRALHTPGHSAGMLAFVVDEAECFTGDTLFAGSVGGVHAPGSTSFGDLRGSIMETLMALESACVVHPGHCGHTTIAREWETNPFVRLWRGLDGEGTEPCRVALPLSPKRDEATLVLWADDYDGGHKAWVRWPDGRDDIVPGSRVER